jgi:hypothetical protein
MHDWFGGIETKALELRPSPYETWLQKKFASFPKALQNLGIAKWLRIREWHLAERRVWRELYWWTTRKTPEGQKRGLVRLRAAYEERNTAYGHAIAAHWPCTRAVHHELKREHPRDALDMLSRHPGAFPPRH